MTGPAGAWRPPLVAGAAVTAVAVLSVALAALLAVAVPRTAEASGADRRAALAAATQGVTTALSYDYRHLQSDFRQADALLTPRFRRDYDAKTAQGVLPLAERYRAVTQMDVIAAGVISAGPDSAKVLVFGQQTSTNTQLSAPRLDKSRIIVTLVKTGGRWLIDALQPI